MTPTQFVVLVEEWKRKQNLAHFGTAQLSLLIVGALQEKSSQKYTLEDFLPFPPPPIHVSIEEANIIIQKLMAEDEGKVEVRRG